jgi:hypothetical protein
MLFTKPDRKLVHHPPVTHIYDPKSPAVASDQSSENLMRVSANEPAIELSSEHL